MEKKLEKKTPQNPAPNRKTEARPSMVDYTKPSVVDYKTEIAARERLRNLAILDGKTVLIHSFNIQNTRLGPRVEITAEVEGKLEKFYTFSRVIAAQLDSYKNELKQGKLLRAKIEKRNRYLTLAPP